MNSDMTHHLLAELELRARASYSALPQFTDRAALLLARELGVNTQKHLTPEEHTRITRSYWLDRQILDVLVQCPKTLGIELNAGINTRFHRLSSQLEWPTFRWADVNPNDAYALSQSLIPITDNYRQLADKDSPEGWLSRAGWQAGYDILLITENADAPFFTHVQKLLQGTQDARIHLVFCSQNDLHLHPLSTDIQGFRETNSFKFLSKNPLVRTCNALFEIAGIQKPSSIQPWLGYHLTTH